MKKIIYLTIVLFSFFVANAQNLEEKKSEVISRYEGKDVYILKSELSEKQLKRLQARTSNYSEIENALDQIGEFEETVDPREIGEAIKIIGGSFTGEVSDFAETPVGEYTVALIAWKIFGTSVTDMILRLLALILFLVFFFATWKKYFHINRFLVGYTLNRSYWILNKKEKKQYKRFIDISELLKLNNSNDSDSSMVLKVGMAIILIAASSIFIFA